MKSDGRPRPWGIAALEDKVVQYAAGTVLNQIWEQDFGGFGYGFRPRRSQHDALEPLYIGITRNESELGAGACHCPDWVGSYLNGKSPPIGHFSEFSRRA